MCRIINNDTEKVKLIENYFSPLDCVDTILRHLSKQGRYSYGLSEYCCVRMSEWYDKDEKKERSYIGDGNIEFIGYAPFFNEDIKTIVSNEEFIKWIKLYAEQYIELYGQKDVIDEYVNMIQEKLNKNS
ncbi:ribonuclease toxin immunity protein CdiI [Pseudobacteroides cellulosolvens]|uniref:CDI immunity protein domain-containing protein n=1 Tax=Pseudobacteroides cellulosolvens ATCC 35603 = DSM 2933 TaxID=398512 RepID=A0A0L6JLY4_9FIRM|nr:hypothetical protein [Pseudobacteroides cellulosolvens]KNY26816.1 hypothetical protein Bccel_2081 [Pseudobacteroides cellulosolvens ATCC 35603 = DSM 2933]